MLHSTVRPFPSSNTLLPSNKPLPSHVSALSPSSRTRNRYNSSPLKPSSSTLASPSTTYSSPQPQTQQPPFSALAPSPSSTTAIFPISSKNKDESNIPLPQLGKPGRKPSSPVPPSARVSAHRKASSAASPAQRGSVIPTNPFNQEQPGALPTRPKASSLSATRPLRSRTTSVTTPRSSSFKAPISPSPSSSQPSSLPGRQRTISTGTRIPRSQSLEASQTTPTATPARQNRPNQVTITRSSPVQKNSTLRRRPVRASTLSSQASAAETTNSTGTRTSSLQSNSNAGHAPTSSTVSIPDLVAEPIRLDDPFEILPGLPLEGPDVSKLGRFPRPPALFILPPPKPQMVAVPRTPLSPQAECRLALVRLLEVAVGSELAELRTLVSQPELYETQQTLTRRLLAAASAGDHIHSHQSNDSASSPPAVEPDRLSLATMSSRSQSRPHSPTTPTRSPNSETSLGSGASAGTKKSTKILERLGWRSAKNVPTRLSALTFPKGRPRSVVGQPQPADGRLSSASSVASGTGSVASKQTQAKVLGVRLEQLDKATCLVMIGSRLHVMPVLPFCAIEEIYRRGMRTPGILRISADIDRIDALVNMFEASPAPSLDLGKEDIHTLCGLLKYYLRALPEPLVHPALGSVLWTLCVQPTREGPRAGAIPAARTVLRLLPSRARSLLAYVLSFLVQIPLFAENRIQPEALANILGPALFAPRTSGSSALATLTPSKASIAARAVSGPVPSSTPDVSEATKQAVESLAWMLEQWAVLVGAALEDQDSAEQQSPHGSTLSQAALQMIPESPPSSAAPSSVGAMGCEESGPSLIDAPTSPMSSLQLEQPSCTSSSTEERTQTKRAVGRDKGPTEALCASGGSGAANKAGSENVMKLLSGYVEGREEMIQKLQAELRQLRGELEGVRQEAAAKEDTQQRREREAWGVWTQRAEGYERQIGALVAERDTACSINTRSVASTDDDDHPAVRLGVRRNSSPTTSADEVEIIRTSERRRTRRKGGAKMARDKNSASNPSTSSCVSTGDGSGSVAMAAERLRIENEILRANNAELVQRLEAVKRAAGLN